MLLVDVGGPHIGLLSTIQVAGEMWVEKLGDKKIARVTKISVEVKVFMVGGWAEDRILSDLRSSYGKGTTFMNQYIKENGL